MDITAITIAFAVSTSALLYPTNPIQAPSTVIVSQAAQDVIVLPSDIQSVLNRPELRNATVGLYAVNLQSGNPILKFNSTRACIPASNQKLLTAAAGLQLLGPDFTWKTDLSSNGSTLHITFDGDPLLTRADLKGALASIKDKFTGPIAQIAIDDTRIQGDPLGLAWQWDDIGFGFSAPVGAATIDKNVVKVTITPPTSALSSPHIEVADGILGIRASTTVSDSRSTSVVKVDDDNKLKITRNPLRPEVEITGTVVAGEKPVITTMAIDNPTDAAFRIIKSLIRDVGIPLGTNVQYVRRPREATDSVLASIVSKPLSETLPDFLKPSDNLYGELLLRTIGRLDGGAATPASGIAKVNRWLQENKIASSGVQPADGSGLSMWNTTTAEATVAILRQMASNATFRSALPIGGIDGTLKARFPSPDHRGKVQAKTGTLSVASCLSGYATTTKGDTIVFSILMNHFDRKSGGAAARLAQDDIVRYLLEL